MRIHLTRGRIMVNTNAALQAANPAGEAYGPPAQNNAVALPAAPAPVSWVVHLYQINFNPGTNQGKAIF